MHGATCVKICCVVACTADTERYYHEQCNQARLVGSHPLDGKISVYQKVLFACILVTANRVRKTFFFFRSRKIAEDLVWQTKIDYTR